MPNAVAIVYTWLVWPALGLLGMLARLPSVINLIDCFTVFVYAKTIPPIQTAIDTVVATNSNVVLCTFKKCLVRNK